MGQNGRSTRVKLNGLKSERSSIKWDAPKDKLMDGRKGRDWTLLEDESRRPKKLKEDNPKDNSERS